METGRCARATALLYGRVLHDADLAEAILDRAPERGRVLHFKGPSYRTRHLREKGVPAILRKEGEEFRELTVGCLRP